MTQEQFQSYQNAQNFKQKLTIRKTNLLEQTKNMSAPSHSDDEKLKMLKKELYLEISNLIIKQIEEAQKKVDQYMEQL